MNIILCWLHRFHNVIALETFFFRDDIKRWIHFQTIEKLPDKVLLNIFSYLSHLEICRMARVCRRWRTGNFRFRVLLFATHEKKKTKISYSCLWYTTMAKRFTAARSVWSTCRIIRIAVSINIGSIWTIVALHRTAHWTHHTYRLTWVGREMSQFNVHVVGFFNR